MDKPALCHFWTTGITRRDASYKEFTKLTAVGAYIKHQPCTFKRVQTREDVDQTKKCKLLTEKFISRESHLCWPKFTDALTKTVPFNLLPTDPVDKSITHVLVQTSKFPRCCDILDLILDIKRRYKVIHLNGTEDGFEKYISFYFVTDKADSDDIIDTFFRHDTEEGNIIKKTNFRSFNDFIISKEQAVMSCFVVPGNMEQISTNINGRTTVNFILAETPREARALSRKHSNAKKITFVIDTDNTNQQVDKAMEKCLLQSLKRVYEELTKDIEQNEDIEKHTLVAQNEKESSNSVEISNAIKSTYHFRRKKIKLAKKKNNERPKESKVVYINEDKLSTMQKETKESLRVEILGVFNMSEASIEDMPTVPQNKSDTELKKIRSVLFAMFKEIHLIGFGKQKLQILLKDGQKLGINERKALHDALQKLHVKEYEIAPTSFKEYIISGDEIVLNKGSATFGCFAKAKYDTDLFGIIPKHVAKHCQQELHVNKDGTKITVGSVIAETVKDGGPDIAAAKISIPKELCDTRFKSASGIPRNTKGANTIPPNRLIGWKVHTFGAKSKPGRGIITVADFQCEEMDHYLIQVEDIIDEEDTIDKRFAQPGDSGAIACTDVLGQKFVNPISMNMGCMNYEDVVEDNKEIVKKKRGKYLTVPLESGLREIGKRIRKPIELC